MSKWVKEHGFAVLSWLGGIVVAIVTIAAMWGSHAAANAEVEAVVRKTADTVEQHGRSLVRIEERAKHMDKAVEKLDALVDRLGEAVIRLEK